MTNKTSALGATLLALTLATGLAGCADPTDSPARASVPAPLDPSTAADPFAGPELRTMGVADAEAARTIPLARLHGR
ncbi:MAG TPA: hypothetical protein VFV40_01595 [Nocardioides sp.]|nr:hypothetical protein [Nocardioides sp.]